MTFKSVAARIARREGVPIQNADAILAASSRRASAAAKRHNPKLFKVAGGATPFSDKWGFINTELPKRKPILPTAKAAPYDAQKDPSSKYYIPIPYVGMPKYGPPLDKDGRVIPGSGVKKRKRCVGCGRLPKRGGTALPDAALTSLLKKSPFERAMSGRGDSIAHMIPKAPEKFKGFHRSTNVAGLKRKMTDASWNYKDNKPDPSARMGSGSKRKRMS